MATQLATGVTDSAQRYPLVKIGNAMIILSVIGLVGTTAIAYPLDHLFAFWIQILAHIGMMVFAVPLKLGYVVRLMGEQGSSLTNRAVVEHRLPS